MTTITINPTLTRDISRFGNCLGLLSDFYVASRLKAAKQEKQAKVQEEPEDEGLTQDRLKEILDYNADTGDFVWKVNRRGKAKAGSVAGNIETNGYMRIRIDYKHHKAHRLAWLYMTGEFPVAGLQVDHRNGIKDDNRFSNLRVVPNSLNSQNRRKANSNNKTGIPNVHKRGNKWWAQVMLDGQYVLSKGFDTQEEAQAAAIAAKIEHHPGYLGGLQ